MENVTKTMEKKDNGNARNSRAKLALILEKILVYRYPEDVTESLINWWTSSACIAV